MDNKEKNFASAVIYVHNAEKHIGVFLKKIMDVMESHFEHSEIICVNDAFTDGSLEKIKEVGAKATQTSITVVNMSYFHGVELSMNAGVDLAIGDFVFEFDNTFWDFHHSLVMKVYRHALEGFDIVSALPDRKARLSSSLFYKMFNRFANYPYKMTTESFRVLSRRAINRIDSMNKMIPYRKAVYVKCGLKMDSVKYSPTLGRDKLGDGKEKSYRLGLAVDSLILFTELGYRFSMMMTVIMMLISIFMGVYSLFTYFTIHPVEGWTTTILFLSLAFFGLFGILTIIVKYLQLLVDMVFKRRYYNFENVEKLT